METKRNVKYFTAPPVNVLAIIGWAIVAFGAVFAVSFRRRAYIGIIIALVGLLILALTSGGKSTDSDIDFQATERIRNLQETSEKKYEVYEKSFLKSLKPINMKGFDFNATEQPFYYRKGSDGKNRCNYFAGVNLIFTGEKVYIYGRRFSFTDEMISEEITGQYFYNELSTCVLEETVYHGKRGNKDVDVPVYTVKVLDAESKPVLSIAVEYGSDIDEYVEHISRVIKQRQVELAKRAEETARRREEFRAKVEAEKIAIANGEISQDELEKEYK